MYIWSTGDEIDEIDEIGNNAASYLHYPQKMQDQTHQGAKINASWFSQGSAYTGLRVGVEGWKDPELIKFYQKHNTITCPALCYIKYTDAPQ